MKKIFQCIAIIQITLIIIQPYSAYAGLLSLFGSKSSGTSGQVRSGIKSFLEDDLNMNVEEGLKPITEGVNSMDRKGKIPRATIRFSTPNPKPGDTLTASAEVEGVSNADKAYFIWFLKRKSDEAYPISGEGLNWYEPPQRLHENAVRAQASIYYDPEMRDQKFNQGMPADGDDDAFDAPLGGKNTGPEDKYCYIYDTKDGKQYEIAGGESSASSSGCAEGYVPRCLIEDSELQCPLEVEPITGSTSSSSSSGSEEDSSSSSSSASTEISGGGGARDEVRMRCLDQDQTPFCDANSGKLQCGSAGSGGWFDCSNGWSTCDTTYAYGTKDSCESVHGEGNCSFRADLSASSQEYSYEGDITVPTPFCVAVTDSGLWMDPNTNGCATAESEGGGDGRPYIRFDGTADQYCGASTGSDANCNSTGGSCNVTIECNGTTETKNFSNPGVPKDGGSTDRGEPCRYEEGTDFVFKPKNSFGKLTIIISADHPDGCTVCINKPDGSQECNQQDGRLGGSANGSAGIHGAHCLEYDPSVKKPEGTCDLASQDEKGCDDSTGVFSREDVSDMSAAVEERYGLNPADDRTTPLADNDGQLIAGVNQQQFTWQYEEGDEITVVVEGQGFESTKHENASYQTVFAMVEPGCQWRLDQPEAAKSSYEEAVKNKVMTHLTANVDPVDCIFSKMYIKPGTSEYDSLNVEVSQGYNEEASVASGLGQSMHITASAGQTQGGSISSSSHLYYDWTVTCNNGSGTTNITDKLEGLSQTSGMNIPALDFVADFPDGKVDENGNPTENCFNPADGTSTVEVTAKINEPRKGGGSNFGKSTQVFTIYNAADSQLEAYKTTVNADGKYSPTDTPICVDGIDKTFCRVMNNEVIALRAKESKSAGDYAEPGMLSWQVNDKAYVCDESISENCINNVGTVNTNTDTILVPMNGREGDFITVAAQVNKVDINSNESKQLMRVFRVTEPSVTIEPVTNVVKKVLGTYTDLDEEKFLDESNNVFIAKKGKEVTLKAVLEPSFLNTTSTGPKLTYEWLVDGEVYDTDSEITFIPESETVVTVEVTQALKNEDRKALKEVFNAGMKDTQAQSYKKTVQIEFDKEELIAQSGVAGFFATASHNAPEYLIFILKMTMLMGIMLLIPSLVLSVGKSA